MRVLSALGGIRIDFLVVRIYIPIINRFMKKKVTLLVLLVSLLVPMTLIARTTLAKNVKAYDNNSKKVTIAAKYGETPTPMVVKLGDNVKTLSMPKAVGDVLTWDFEDADAAFGSLTPEDRDNDGFNWTYYNNTGVETGRMTAHAGEGLIASASYDNDGRQALFPDNWLISPELTLGGSLTFWAAGQDASYAAEVFGVYVTVDGTNYVQLGADKVATDEYVLYEYDLSAYDGQTGRFAIVHHNVTDMFFLNVDDITFDPAGVVTPEPGLPTSLTADPSDVSAMLAWTAGENNGSWDLRWRPYVDPATVKVLWDFSLENYSEQVAGFMVYDADGDGNNWGLSYSSSAQDDACFYSVSYSSSLGALDPDNWLITPAVGLGGTLKFKAWQQSTSYPDKIQVYVCTNTDWQDVSEFTSVSEIIQPSTDDVEDAEEFVIDLSGFEGEGIIAFRHYDSYNQYAIFIDDIEVTPPNAQELAEWTIVEDAANPYQLEGLTPATEYEFQVMAFNEPGDKSSIWTESLVFTTLAEQLEVAVAQSENGSITADKEKAAPGETVTLTVKPNEGYELKSITVETVDAVVPSDISRLRGAQVDVVPGETDNTYQFVMPDSPVNITATFKKWYPTAIEEINVNESKSGKRYNLMGQPVGRDYKGVVIENGKKIIVK